MYTQSYMCIYTHKVTFQKTIVSSLSNIYIKNAYKAMG